MRSEKRKTESRVLARRLARELTPAEVQQICGHGTSYYGTLGCDEAGRGGDIRAGDCVNGDDTFQCE